MGTQENSHAERFDIIVEEYSTKDTDYYTDTVNWAPPYDKLITTDKERVRRDCGDRYVREQFNEARLFVVIHVSNTRASTLSSVRGSLNAKIGVGWLGANADLALDRQVKESNQQGAISFEAYQEGFDDFSPASILPSLSQQMGIVDVQAILRKTLEAHSTAGQPVA